MRRALLALMALLLAAVAAAEPVARSARVEAADGATRVVLRFDAPPRLTLFTLDDPPRVVLDFPGARLELPPTPGAGLAARLRHGVAEPGRARLVVDLAGPAVAAAAVERGVVTLTLSPTAAAAFRAGAGWPPGLGPVAAAAPPRRVVALDPGHGGVDPGAVRGGLREKDVTLDFSLALAAALREAGFEVALTREADTFVSLPDRVERARAAGAALFLSIHADALPAGEASGASVYTLSATASDAEAAALARRENRADEAAGAVFAAEDPDVAAALLDLVRRDTMAASERLGRTLVAALGERVPLLSGNPLRAAGFRVLKAPDMPSALIELGFLSSAVDRARLVDPEWRAQAVAALVAAVAAWFAEADGAQGR